MDDPRQPLAGNSIRRLPWLGLREPLEFEHFARTCTLLDTDPAGPMGTYLARLSELPERLVSRFLAAPDTAALAVLCRSLGFSRDAFEALTLSCAPTFGSLSMAPARALFDALSRQRAEGIVACWRVSEPGYGGPARLPIPKIRRDA